MELQIDWTRCDGHGICRALLPTRLSADEWGYPVLHDASVPDASIAEVRRAVAACPALALRLTAADRQH